MSAGELALLAFTACNSLRVLAYLPQILRIARDTGGAAAISYTTWSLFALSHLSTVAYAALTLRDTTMVLVFAANTACCLAIVGATFWKRRALRRREAAAPVPEASGGSVIVVRSFRSAATPVPPRAGATAGSRPR